MLLVSLGEGDVTDPASSGVALLSGSGEYTTVFFLLLVPLGDSVGMDFAFLPLVR